MAVVIKISDYHDSIQNDNSFFDNIFGQINNNINKQSTDNYIIFIL